MGNTVDTPTPQVFLVMDQLKLVTQSIQKSLVTAWKYGLHGYWFALGNYIGLQLVKVACVCITYNVEQSAIQILHSMVTTGYQNPIEKKYLDQKVIKLNTLKGLPTNYIIQKLNYIKN